MTCRTRWRWPRPCAAALLALLAGASAPAPAHAGCGTPRGLFHGPEVMPAHSPAAPAQGAPCRGPGCSQGPAQPLTVPVTTPSAPGHDLACVTPRLPLAGLDSSPRHCDSAPLLPPPHHADVYHPPR